MLLDNFRTKLRKEAELWRDEGLINVEQYEELAQRYNKDIDQVQQQSRQRQARPIVVEIKVDTQGKAVPVSFWIEQRNYRF